MRTLVTRQRSAQVLQAAAAFIGTRCCSYSLKCHRSLVIPSELYANGHARTRCGRPFREAPASFGRTKKNPAETSATAPMIRKVGEMVAAVTLCAGPWN